MTYKDIKDKLRKPTQFICAGIGIQKSHFRTGNEVLLNKLKIWLKGMKDGTVEVRQDGFYDGPFLISTYKGTKDECQLNALNKKSHLNRYDSTDKLERLSRWETTWLVLPSDEYGNWVPTRHMITKALELL